GTVEPQHDGAVAAETGGEIGGYVSVDRIAEPEDLAAAVVGIHVFAVIRGRPDPDRYEGTAGDHVAGGAVAVGVDGVGHARGWGSAVSGRARGARALAHVPAIVGCGLPQIDL